MTRARIRRVRLSLPRSVGNATARWTERESVLVVLEDAQGHAGQGEASPLPGFSRDDPDACERALREACARGARFDDAALQATPAARFALETATLDLEACSRGVPFAGLLAGDRASAATSCALLDGAPSGWPAQAVDRVGRGFRTVKVKIGGPDFEREIDALEAARAALGVAIAIRLDVNGAWTLAEARTRLARLAERVAPEFVEEPVRGASLLALGRCAVPWAADESLLDHALRERVLDAPGIGAVVLKPALLGGLAEARRLALAAIERGLAPIVSHLFDGPIGLAAACALATTLPSQRAAHGLAPHAALEAWPRVALTALATDGVIAPSRAVGLGLPLLEARFA